MDDFLILLQAKLDEAKSKGNVNTDIEKIQGQIDKLKIQAEIDPKTISNLVKQLEGVLNQKINISNININSNEAIKSAQQTGQRIGNAINQGITNVASKASKALKSFTELKIGTGNIDAILDKDGLLDAERSLSKIKQIYSEFGQVKITNKIFDPEGNLQQFRVDIQQVNGELKESRNFMMALSSDGKSFGFPQDVIKGSESFVHHLNEAKNISNATGEELNAQKEKLAESEKYYTKLEQASKEQLAIEKQRITAGEKQLEILDAQSKRRDSRISYNEGQIDKKGLTDTSKQREINDLVYSGKEKLDTSFAKEIDKSLSSLSKLKEKWQEQGVYVDEFRTKVENLEKSLNEVSIGDVKGLNDLKQQLSSLSTEAQNLSKINEIQLSMETGEYESKVESLIVKTRQWTDTEGNARISTTNLSTALNELTTASETYANNPTEATQKRLIESSEKLDTEYKKITNSVRSMNAEMAKDSAIASLHNKVADFMSKNGKAIKYSGEFKRIFNETTQGAQLTRQEVTKLNQEFNNAVISARDAGKLGKTFFQTIREGMSSFSYWTSSTFLVMKSIQSVKGGLSSVRELDTALVDLKKTTSMTNKELEEFYYTSNDVAKQMGVTTKEILDQASAWSRLGFSSAEAATKMAQYSSKFASISPGMSVDQAQEGLVSIIKAWGLDVDEVEREVLDNINTLGNKFAESNADLVQGMKRSAAALAATGTTYQDAFALFTGAQEVVQNAEVTGRALRSISMRIHGYSEDSEDGLEVLDEELKNITGDLIDLTKTAEHSQGVSIFKEGSTTEFKSLVEYFGEINDIWSEMSQVQQNAFLDKAFGKNQAQAGAAIIQNYETIADAMAAMEDAGGSAEREMSIIMDSIDYKLNTTAETATGIAQNLFKKDDMKSVIDVFNSFMSVLDKVTEKLGLFGTLTAGAGLFTGIKNVGKPKMFGFNYCFEYADSMLFLLDTAV